VKKAMFFTSFLLTMGCITIKTSFFLNHGMHHHQKPTHHFEMFLFFFVVFLFLSITLSVCNVPKVIVA